MFMGGSVVKNPPAMQEKMKETQVWSLGQEDPLEKEMASHSRILAWRIPWTEQPGGLQSMGWQRTELAEATDTHTYMLCTHKQLYQMTVLRYWGIERLLAYGSKICTDALFVLVNSFSKEIFTGRRQRICLPMQVPLEPVNWALPSGVSNPGLQTHK